MGDHRYSSTGRSCLLDAMDGDQMDDEENVGDLSSTDVDEIFIGAVKAYPCFWSKRLSGFKDNDQKLAAWTEISESFAIPVEICKKRWESLKKLFSKERKMKELEEATGSGVSDRPQWSLWQNMQFMDDNMPRRRTISNFSRPVNHTNVASFHHANPGFQLPSSSNSDFDIDPSPPPFPRSIIHVPIHYQNQKLIPSINQRDYQVLASVDNAYQYPDNGDQTSITYYLIDI